MYFVARGERSGGRSDRRAQSSSNAAVIDFASASNVVPLALARSMILSSMSVTLRT
jgi:hypothetical protein